MQFPFHKFGLIFRLVEEGDAEFILSLRTDKVHARYLSPTDNDLQKQIDWIREYKKREEKREEFYFLFANEDNEPVGVVRVYDIKDDTYTNGSWIVKPGCDEFISIKSDLFLSEFAATELKNKRCVFDVRKDNKKALRFHKMFARVTGEDELNYYFTIDEDGAKRKNEFLTSII
ncbi:Acetyltransferase (GNAT) domain-containing protein [Mucilaginibacter gossypiicola]|uniref:Acetyltransferase (GNAT) domain-containing protein n=1 Tax=Mucilaginibacter gossypiicola TaxID=551995 RepID=A0A1H8N315_9SPHI|nr:GNAT family N-acetyltransferase [Mucilaginibacter gossypiicola]SEO24035.1 Acetyltransferase (GNAT) domain-containing protein [Mucilaginibacter gossypiicola]